MAKQLRIVQDLVEAAQQYPVDVGREVGRMPERLMEGVVDQFEELPGDVRDSIDSFLGYGAESLRLFNEKAGEVAEEAGEAVMELGQGLARPFTKAPPPPAPVADKLALPPVDSCFIATALAKAHGLGDDCHMLKVLREFRDTYMQEDEYRRELVEQYYREAPAITEALKDSLIWDYAASVIWYVVRDIETGSPDVAMERYKGLFCTMRYEAAKARER